MKKKALASLDLLVFIGLFLFASCGNRLLLDNEESIKNPEAPTINKIIPGDGKVYLEWTLPTDGSLIRASEYARQYRIYYSETAIDIATSKYVETGVHSGDRKITISGLTNWTEYNFAVMAINYGGVSDISASKAATPAPIDITTLDPPSYSPLILYTSLTSSPYWGSSDPSVTYKALGNWPTELTLSSDGVVSLAFSAGTKAIGNYQIEVTGNGSNTGVITVNIVVLLNPIKLGEVAGFSLDVDDRAVTALTADTYMAITNSARLIPGTDYSLSLSSAPPGGALTITKEGRIIIPDTLALSNNGMTYTLRAEGKGAYLEFLEKSFVLTVAPKDINSLTGLTLGYAPQNVNANPPTEIPVSGSLSHGLRAGTDLTFDITARPQGSNKAAVTIDSGSGDITIKDTIIGTDGGGYTVTATGQGNYAGSKEESFFLTVNSVSIELLEGTNASAPPAGTAISKSYGDASFNLYAKTTTTGSFTGDLVSWSSGNAAVGVAQDPTDGHLASITANQPGSATITAYSNEGSGVAASIDIDVDEKSVQSGSVTLMYGPISSIVPGAATGNTSSPIIGGLLVGSDLLADAVIFSIAKTNQGDPGPDPSSGDIIIDRDSGVVTVDPAQTNIFGQTFYTVTMTGKGNYKDSKTVDIHIAVDDPNGPVITGDFDYIIPTSITYGEAAKTIDVTINQNITGTDVRYDIKNPIQGITIDSVSGQLTINSTLGLGSHNIIIAATSTGTQGEIERSFTTSVSRRSLKNIQGFSLNYLDQTKTARTGDTISSGLINNVNLTAGTDYILYITPPAGITSPGKLTINNDGTITIPSTVTVNDRGTYTIEAQGLGNYTESVTDIFTLTLEKRSITNWVNLMYSDKGVTAKTPTTISRDSDGGLQGLIPGTDLTFTISGPSSKVSIASDTGEITIPGTITTSDGGSYTVTAAGENDYKDTQTDTFSLAVSRKDIGSITFSLTPNSGGVKASIASTIQTAITNDGGLAAGKDYDIAYITPPSSTSTTEVTIDSNGVIGIGSGIVDNDAGDYIVTFTGKGEYTGSASTTFTLNIKKNLMTSLLQFHYADTEVIQAAAKTIPITVTDSGGLILGTDYTLSITGRPTNASSSALAINSSTGEITITSNAPTDDEGVYTVTAEGQGNYAGNKHTSFTLTVLSPTTTQPRTLQHVIALGTIPSTNALSNDYDTFTQEVLRNYPPGAAVVGKYITETEKGAGNASSWANAADVGWLEDIVTNTPDTAKMVYLVLVGAGTHKPAATLAMRNNAAIIGGWEAAGSWSRRGGQTTFDGDNARQVFFNFNIDNTSLLYDVTISNGQSMYGSGMSNNNASPVLSNVTFSDNAASIDGGGMSSQGLSSPILTDVTFLRNTAGRHGGGMDHDNSSSLTLTRVKFLKNTADKHGGGMYTKASTALTDVTFSGNSSINGYGGGMYNEQSSSRLTNVTFSDNKAESGGGMYNYQASSVFTNVTFSGNTATTKNGGGVYYEGSSPINLTNVTFSDNEATLGSGGGIYSDNGGRSGLVVTNSLFWGNSAGGSGNQIYLYNNNSGVETLQIYNSIVEDGIKGPGSSPSGIGYYDTTYSGIINVNITFDQIVTVNPDLQPLADNGGFVETHALLSGSSALDLGLYVRQSITTPTTWYYSLDNVDWYTDLANPGTGSPQGSTKNMTAADARSYTRNTRPDIGAFEEGATPPILDGLNGKSASVP